MNHKMMRLAIEGQGLVEYALIILFVAIAAVLALTGLGGVLSTSLGSSGGAI